MKKEPPPYHVLSKSHARGFQIVQAISEQQSLFFILNYRNFGSSCYTENYNGQHLISTVFFSSSSIICFSYHKNLKL